MKRLFIACVASMGLLTGPVAAVGATTPTEDLALYDTFVSNLRAAAKSGDNDAKDGYRRALGLTADDKRELNRFFKGNHNEHFPGAISSLDGKFEVDVTSNTRSDRSANPAHYLEYSAAFSFLGIKITETKVSGSYETNGKDATKINSHQCSVVRNYDPTADVKTSPSNSYVSGGNATFLCHVSVKRGVPTAWGRVTWSTKEGTQGLVGDGKGRVVNQGWM